MEDTLREYMKTKTVFYLRVLILVLMEDTLRDVNSVNATLEKKGS